MHKLIFLMLALSIPAVAHSSQESAPSSEPANAPAALPPSAQDFATRIALVGVGALIGEAVGGYGGLLLGQQLSPLSSGFNFTPLVVSVLVLGGTGAILGASLFGAIPAPGFNASALLGTVVGTVVGTLACVLTLALPLGPAPLILPVVGATIGYAVAYRRGGPELALGGRSFSSGVRVMPSIAVSPLGTVQSALVGSF